MRPRLFCRPFLCALACLGLSPGVLPAGTVPIAIGQSVAVLYGPWKFHTGDDPRWADPDFADEEWETVDLTPLPGAHDGDVGLTGYVPGWASKGHQGYAGYAWYRLRALVSAPSTDKLALAGPRAVDSAYQIFVNGRMLGGVGDFSGRTPVVYSIQPRIFPLSLPLAGQVPEQGARVVVAVRVWMGPGLAGEPGAGGLHIAPELGEARAVQERYKLAWLETVRGYIVEVVEAGAFVLLAGMAGVVMAFDRSNTAYLWLSAGLLLLAVHRANQAFLFWTQHESVYAYDLMINVLVLPLLLGGWTMAWFRWFRLRGPAWIVVAAGALTVLYMGSQWAGRTWCPLVFLHSYRAGFHAISADLRWLFVVLLACVGWWGVRKRGYEGWIALPVMALVAIGLFAQELSALHVRSIWFPYGTGVSRTQFAYIGFDLALLALLLRRLLFFARQEKRDP